MWTTWNSKCTHCFFWPLSEPWISPHKGQMLSRFSCKFVDSRFCKWRPDTSSPWCPSSSPPSSLFAPAAQNTPAWPAPQSRRRIFSQTCKHTPVGHDFNHFISHVEKQTLQNPNQIKPSWQITPNAFKNNHKPRPPTVTSSYIKALTFISKHTCTDVQPKYTPLPSSMSLRTWRWGCAETPPIGCTLAVPASFSELAPPPHQLNFHLILQMGF